ncbi:glycosyltransferase [bacterium]|nr:glycosyltransferase [bacterium]
MRKQFKILYISHFGKFVGGGQKGLLYILERINRDCFDPVVVAPSQGSFLDRAAKLGISTKCLKMGKLNPLNLIITVPKIAKLIWTEKINLIYTDSPRGAIYGGIAAKIIGRPLVYHARVSDKSRLDKLIYILSTKIITVSKASAERFKNGGKVKIIYNAIDLNEFNPDIDGSKIREEFSANDLLIGTMGRVSSEKGQKELLHTVPDILKAYPKIKFVIVGGGNPEYIEKLKKLCQKLGITNNVIFTGFREDIPEIMAAIDIFALFTSNEGLCRSILEAMGTGKPVITTDVGGNSETIKNEVTGILIPFHNPSLLKDALFELIRDKKKRKEMGRRGRERAVKLFDIEENIRKIEKIYLEVLKVEYAYRD